SAGAWITSLIPNLQLPLSIERQVLCWFEPVAHRDFFRPDRCPIYIWEYAHSRFFYGFPDMGDGVKLALHHEGTPTEPYLIRREVDEEEIKAVRTAAKDCVPDASGQLLSATACMYTNAPDSHFVFGRHPNYPQVLIASPCSGHGFKFSSAIGEILADLLTDAPCAFDLSPFRIARFAPAR